METHTHNGDRGFTNTLRGDRVPKSSQLIEAVGTLDEFMTCCGLVRSALLNENHCLKHMSELERDLYDAIEFIQERIISINEKLVSVDSMDGISEEDVKHVEDGLDKLAPAVDSTIGFVKFRGGKFSSYIQHARSVCRRAERELWRLQSHYLEHHAVTAKFMNRLSDWLLAFGYAFEIRGE